MKLSQIICLTSFIIASSATAQTKQEMKCYVKDAAGIDKIYLIKVKSKQVSKLTQSLLGRKFNKGKQKNLRIDSVIECVNESESFNDVVARQLDNVTVR